MSSIISKLFQVGGVSSIISKLFLLGWCHRSYPVVSGGGSHRSYPVVSGGWVSSIISSCFRWGGVIDYIQLFQVGCVIDHIQ